VTYRRYRTSRRGARVLTFVAFLAMIMIGVEAGARAQQAAGEPEQKVVAQDVSISGVDVSADHIEFVRVVTNNNDPETMAIARDSRDIATVAYQHNQTDLERD